MKKVNQWIERYFPTRWLPGLGVCLLLLATGCSDDDDYTYPSVRSEFVDGYINHQQVVERIITDGGKTLMLENQVSAKDYKTDSIYRFYCMYALSDNNSEEALVYRLRQICSSLPKPKSEFQSIVQDPLKIQSLWRGGDYLNIVARPMIQSEAHSYAFIEEAVEKAADGTQKIYLSLFHDRNGDVEAYEEDAYLSVPLKQYHLQSGDSIFFTAVTYDGSKTWKFGE